MAVPEGAPVAARISPKLAGNMLVFGLFVMVRRQLAGIRDRVEGRPIAAVVRTRRAANLGAGRSPHPLEERRPPGHAGAAFRFARALDRAPVRGARQAQRSSRRRAP